MPQWLGQLQNPDTSFGIEAGKSIGNLLNTLATRKAHQIKTGQNRQFLQSLGIDPQVASGLAQYDDKNIFDFLKNFEGYNIGNQAQSYSAQPEQQTQGLTPQQIEQGANPNQPNTPRQNLQQQSIPQLVEGLYTQHPELREQVKPAQLAQLVQRQLQQQNNNQPQQQMSGIKPTGVAAAERAARVQQLKDQYKESLEERKESKEFLKELNKEYKVSKENDMRLDKMENLINTGRLSPALLSSSLNSLAKGIFGVGIDLRSLLTPETQEFEKLSSDFVKGAKNIFGSRITDQDLKVFLNTIPNIGQSNEAKLAVIENLRVFNKGVEARQKAAKDIIKYNNGVVPANLESLVEEAVEPKLNKLAEEFKQIKKRDVAPSAGYAFKPGQYQELKNKK